jgi:hypothetical protein
LEQRYFIKERQHVDTFLNTPDEIIVHGLDEDQFIEQLSQSYAKRPEADQMGQKYPLQSSSLFLRQLGGLKTSRAFAV